MWRVVSVLPDALVIDTDRITSISTGMASRDVAVSHLESDSDNPVQPPFPLIQSSFAKSGVIYRTAMAAPKRSGIDLTSLPF